ncbi:hypothetical protein EVAR_10693_1 [Eumeta japonica]|uniref:Uncharacterized protein n=1 Tax=Eumeta variegata TaxID=151549 RepID=A0A4C1U707_EUMVA|nr:hypothetical protein EVAR_10693_1 [Eumeta japonica]
MLCSQATSLATGRTTSIASPSAAGRHMRVPTARDMPYGRLLKERQVDQPVRVRSVAYGYSGWGAAADSQPPLEGAHWDVIPRCRKIASMRPSCTLIRWGVRANLVAKSTPIPSRASSQVTSNSSSRASSNQSSRSASATRSPARKGKRQASEMSDDDSTGSDSTVVASDSDASESNGSTKSDSVRK